MVQSLQQKRLLILGAGRGQIGLYKAAQSLGIYSIAATMPGEHLPGLSLADEVCFMNIAKPGEVIEKISSLQIDGVVTSCLDTGVRSLGRICDTFALTGLSEQSAMMCNDKLAMKRALIKKGVCAAAFFEISDRRELQDALTKLTLPVIIKATDLQGSNGVYICNTEDQAVSALQKVMQKTKQSSCIVEEFISGVEFGAQAFVYDGELLFVMPHGDDLYKGETPVPVGHYVPLQISEDVQAKVSTVVAQAVDALGLNNCAVNVDLILKNNQVYVIELTGRVGANCLPELVSAYFNIDYYRLIILAALSENPLDYWRQHRQSHKTVMSSMIVEFEQSGVLEEISYIGADKESVLDVSFFKSRGDEIRKFQNSNDCIGQVIVQEDSEMLCRQLLENVLSNVKIKLR